MATGTIYFSADNGQFKGIVGSANPVYEVKGLYKTWACTVYEPTAEDPHYYSITYTNKSFTPPYVSRLFHTPAGYSANNWKIWNQTKKTWIGVLYPGTWDTAMTFAGGTAADLSGIHASIFGSGDELWLYPDWAAFIYTIWYNGNGGSGVPYTQEKKYGQTIKLDTTIPKRAGYTFKCWNTHSDGTGLDYKPGASFSANINITMYAMWTPNPTVTITYNNNTGSGTTPSQSCYSGASVTLTKSNLPTKDNTTRTVTVTYNKGSADAVIVHETVDVTKTKKYTFKNWNTRADGKGTSYNPGDVVTLTKNMTLYAVYNYVETGDVTLETATLAQYSLLGWSESKTNVQLVKNPYSPVKDVTLYAIWTPNGQSFLKFYLSGTEEPTQFVVGHKVRIVGFKDNVNDGVYTIASVSCTPVYDAPLYLLDDESYDENDVFHIPQEPEEGDVVIGYDVVLQFVEDFQVSGVQGGAQYNLRIYGEGTHVPDIDYIAALNNRLWGCSSENRTIYASALGEPADFWTFAGDTLDAYQVAVGSAGDFTGCVAMNNNVVFLKQHCVHKMMGNYPAEYTLYTYDIEGASESNGLSAINANGSILYVAESGISIFSGSATSIMSTDLGRTEINNAIAGFNGEKYFLSFEDGDGNPKTYIYDTRYRLWLEDDFGEVLGFAHLKDKDYVLEHHAEGNQIYLIDSEAPHQGDWSMTFRDIYEVKTSSGWSSSSSSIFEKKRYTHLTFRLDLPEGSWLKAEIKTDDGRWRPVARTMGRKNRVQDFVFRTPRADKMQLRLSGHGACTILGMERSYTVGSRR